MRILNSVEHGLSATSSLNPARHPHFQSRCTRAQGPKCLGSWHQPGLSTQEERESTHLPRPGTLSRPQLHHSPHPTPTQPRAWPTFLPPPGSASGPPWGAWGGPAASLAGAAPSWTPSLPHPPEVPGTSQGDRGRGQCQSDLWAAREAQPAARRKWLSAASHKADGELAAGRV